MKRGNDDGKIVGPIFPRLHINDTEKGGPRPPPRNKMALYEQLTFPSHRHNHGAVPLKPNSNNNLVPIASTSQGISGEGSTYFPVYKPPLTPSIPANKLQNQLSDAVNLDSSLGQGGRGKKLADDDDCMVPIFSQCGIDQYNGKGASTINGERYNPVSSSHPPSNDKETNRSNGGGFNSSQDIMRQEGKNSRELVSNVDHIVKDTSDLPARDIANGHQQQGATCGVVLKEPLGPCDARLDEMNNGSQSHRDKAHGSLQRVNTDGGDNVSKTPMVDSLSVFDMSPDDVVGIIGLKHFWTARRAIVNQQRAFAIQVFELHRLIKVQRLIAGSPHLLLEDSAYMGKSSLKGSSLKKLPADCAVITVAPATKQKDDSQKLSYKMEGSAENAVGRSSAPSPQNGTQPPNHRPLSGDPPAVPVPTDAEMMPWCFPHPSGHQWLVPVMSPSEGLIYKPYPAPGLIGPICGGYGPLHPTPMVGNFMNPAYSFPPHFHEGIGIPPTFSFNSRGYFPPYGMLVMNPAISGLGVEQMNGVSGSNPNSQIGPNQSSCNMPNQGNGAITSGGRMPASKDSELQGSTASSPGERTQGVMIGPTVAGRDALSLFPTAPNTGVSEGAHRSHEADQRSRVIRVVAHNPRSAAESATRILLSIQEERKQNDSN
ncbi:Protein EARLY FLOWERING [Ancistrocladus abbreviatus]